MHCPLNENEVVIANKKKEADRARILNDNLLKAAMSVCA
jgi:hypothetical protein